MGPAFPRNHTYVAPATQESEGNVKTTISDLEPNINQEEKEIVTVKAGLSEEIKRAHSEFDTTEILPEAKETARPSNRRRKIRVYLP